MDHGRTQDDGLLRRAGRAVSAAPDLAAAFDGLIDIARERVDFDRASMSAVDHDGLEVVASAGPAAPELPVGTKLQPSDPLVRSVLEASTILLSNVDRVRGGDDARARGVQSAVSVPVIAQNEVRAVVSFVSHHTDTFTPEDLSFLEALVRESAGVLHVLQLLDREREATRRLRELDQLKNTFVGIVAHDLRSPMQVIAGFADTMRFQWDSLPDELKLEYLGIIARNITNLAQLVDDVLQVERIEAGELEFRVEPFDLGRLVQRTVGELTADRVRRCIVDVPPDLPPALGDERRHWQVLMNLIGNAFKFSDPATPIEVRVEHRAAVVCPVLEVSVRDRGIGLRPEDVAKVFEKFTRLIAPDSGPKGTGLGLYICKTMVEAQGGEISVESVPGEGSTFRYTVPAA
jgi:signal transduction histidine kinase